METNANETRVEVDRRALLRAGIPARYMGLTKADLQRFEHWGEVYRFVAGIDKAFTTGAGLLLCGATQTGKSAAAAAIAMGARQRDRDVRFASAYQINRDVEERAYDKEDETSLEAHYVGVGLLVVDDLGSEQPLSRRGSHLPHVLMQRFQGLRPTIVTTMLVTQAEYDAMRMYPKGFMERLAGWLKPVVCTDRFTRTEV